ncbi:MAG: FliI/YscN family ATPase [Proteobacteria bacterium]|nr:FliI/YscN family ATPase [Pseudomonadota bacterium]NBY19268.1 FliI/YscN family ATPase [bacterium]
MLERAQKAINETEFVRYYGKVTRVRKDSIRVMIPNVRVGTLCWVQTSDGKVPIEIVSLDPEGHVAMPLDELGTVQLGDRVEIGEAMATIPAGNGLLGQVVDSMCRPYENGLDLRLSEKIPLYGESLNPLKRELISQPLDLGVGAINACLTTGKGQRTGIFAGSGVGKSVLLGMMARYTEADVVVIGLIGERGREVREFIERELGAEGMKKSVVVVETADKSPVRRVRGAFVAAALAEYYRKQGLNVLLLMDSLTRFAMAQREIGMAAGEPPTTKGYTPSVFNSLNRLVERAGNWGEKGSITGLYTVLVEGDDLEDPVADNARAILDGHIVLSRRIANRGHYPAIDVLTSVSRVMDQVVDKEHSKAARNLKELMARYIENEDSINYGMYIRGSDPKIDDCIEKQPGILDFLKQNRDTKIDMANSREKLLSCI